MPISPSAAESRIHGRDALEAVGIPLEFAAQVMLLANKLGVAIAIRAGKPFQLYMDLCAPKPPYIKAKTGNWGFTKGVVPDEYRLSKINTSRALITPPARPQQVKLLHHKIKLNEIINGLYAEPAEYALESLEDGLTPEAYVRKTNRLVVRCITENTPLNNRLLFSIDLTQHNPPQVLNADPIRTKLYRSAVVTPFWWDHKWGEFADVAAHRYPTFFIAPSENVAQPIYVYAIEQGDHLVPVTGDMDLLWISKPSNAADIIYPHSAHSVLNTANLEDTAKMLEALIELHQFFADQKDEKFDLSEIRDESIGREGCITPFESFFISLINERFAEFAPHITNLFQHGAENRNPGVPSDIDGKVLHIWNGQIILTESEIDLVDFVLHTPGYLENNYIDVHPKWQAALWAPVLAKQAALKHKFLLHKIFNELKISTPVNAVQHFVDKVKESYAWLPLTHPLPASPHASPSFAFVLIRNKPVGSYVEAKRFTSKEAWQKLETICAGHGWTLDKLARQLSFQKDQLHYVFQLDADNISVNHFDATAVFALIKLAMIFELKQSEMIVHAVVKQHEEKFYQALRHLQQQSHSNPVEEDIQKIDAILRVTTLVKRFNPLAYTSMFKRPMERKLSFNADAKAQRAWLNFFNQKSSDMSEDEKLKFVRAHKKIHQIIDEFDEANTQIRHRGA